MVNPQHVLQQSFRGTDDGTEHSDEYSSCGSLILPPSTVAIEEEGRPPIRVHLIIQGSQRSTHEIEQKGARANKYHSFRFC